MADPGARAAVLALQALGLHSTDIGRAIGRDPGAVRQIARGERSAGYGAAYRDSLRDLLAQTSGLNAPAARARAADVGRGGELVPARRAQAVRQPTRAIGKPHTPSGLPGAYVRGAGAGRVGFDRQLDRAAANGQTVYLKVTVSDPRARSGKRDIGLGEMDAAELRDRLADTGRKGLKRQLQALLDDMSDDGEIGSDSGPVTGFALSVIGT